MLINHKLKLINNGQIDIKMSIVYAQENTKQLATIPSDTYQTKLKKHVLDQYEENSIIDRLRKLSYEELNFQPEVNKKDRNYLPNWWQQTGNIPKELMLKLRKLQSNFLKEQQQNKNIVKNNNQTKNKTYQQQQKKLSDMMSRLELQMNSNSIVPLGQRNNQENVPKALHSKLTQLYNQYITHQRNNQIKRQQLQAKQRHLQEENNNLKQLEQELKMKQKQLEELKFLKMHEQQQRIRMNQKISMYFEQDCNQNQQL